MGKSFPYTFPLGDSFASDGRLGALPALEELLEAQPEETELRQAVETLRDSARWQAAHWQTWSVAAWRGQ